MAELAKLQSWMLSAITGDEQQFQEALQGASNFVRGAYGLDVESRLWIYRGMFPLRMLESLQMDYPGVLYALGERRFARLVMDYVKVYPSKSWTLNRLGDMFPRYIRECPNLRGRLFLGELARLEGELARVFDEAESRVLAAEHLASLNPLEWLELRVEPVAAVRLLRFRYPVSTFLYAVDSGNNPPWPRQTPQYVLISRHNYRLNRQVIAPEAHFMLDCLFQGQPLGRVMARVARKFPDLDPALVQGWFAQWARAGVFAAPPEKAEPELSWEQRLAQLRWSEPGDRGMLSEAARSLPLPKRNG